MQGIWNPHVYSSSNVPQNSSYGPVLSMTAANTPASSWPSNLIGRPHMYTAPNLEYTTSKSNDIMMLYCCRRQHQIPYEKQDAHQRLGKHVAGHAIPNDFVFVHNEPGKDPRDDTYCISNIYTLNMQLSNPDHKLNKEWVASNVLKEWSPAGVFTTFGGQQPGVQNGTMRANCVIQRQGVCPSTPALFLRDHGDAPEEHRQVGEISPILRHYAILLTRVSVPTQASDTLFTGTPETARVWRFFPFMAVPKDLQNLGIRLHEPDSEEEKNGGPPKFVAPAIIDVGEIHLLNRNTTQTRNEAGLFDGLSGNSGEQPDVDMRSRTAQSAKVQIGIRVI